MLTWHWGDTSQPEFGTDFITVPVFTIILQVQSAWLPFLVYSEDYLSGKITFYNVSNRMHLENDQFLTFIDKDNEKFSLAVSMWCLLLSNITGCPIIQSCSVTNYPESTQIPQVRARFHKTSPTSDNSQSSQDPGGTHNSEQPAINWGFPQPSPWVW